MLTSTQTFQIAASPPLENDISFSWKKELKELFSKIFNVVWWPLFKYRQRYFTHSSFFTYCKTLPGFSNLWNTIQKGSFAYNILFLRIKPIQRSSRATDLADITTLALFFGDEFIDGICEAAGKCNILKLVTENHEQFYLQKKFVQKSIQLEYRFDLTELLPGHLMQEINPKYEISYLKFYSILQYFLQLMNYHLSRLPFEKSRKVADKIIDVCNNCLDSYFHDVNCSPVGEKIHDVSTVLHFHEIKTRRMQEKLLDLRCTLSGKEEMMDGDEIRGWLEIMSVVQIADDLEDALEDDGMQDNLIVSTAFHHFPAEWNWFCTHKSLMQKAKHKQLLLSLYMPQTICYCLHLAAGKMKLMNWEQQKIMHYLVFKNWFSNNRDHSELLPFDGEDLLKETYSKLKPLMATTNDDIIKSYVIDLCFHLHRGRQLIRTKAGWSKYYRLRYNLLSIPVIEKAALFNKICKQIFNDRAEFVYQS